MRLDLASFISASFRELNPGVPYKPNPHIQVMAEVLRRVMAGEIKRLIINLPPRSLKSHSVSVAFVAWYLGHLAHHEVICASYGQDLADNLARDTRQLMQSRLYRETFRTRLSDRSAVNDFATTVGGGRMATSVGGVLTGRGGDLIIIDDPMKAEDGLSPSARAAVIQWFEHTLLSRLNDKESGAIIVVAQRLHQEDLCGHLIEQGGWTVLNFPAIAIEDEVHPIGGVFDEPPFRRKAGQALHPARESLATLLSIRDSIGEYNFESQYQQQPVPLEGTIIKRAWLTYCDRRDLPERFSMKVISWDTASKTGPRNDYSVATIWGVLDGKFYLLDVRRVRLEFSDLEDLAYDLAKSHPGATVLIEDRSSGTQLSQNLQLRHLPGVVDYNPGNDRDKIERVVGQSSVFRKGQVLLPKSAPWLGAYESELLAFPGGRHDDQVDSTVQALAYMRETMFEEEIPHFDLDLGVGWRRNPWAIGDN
jgi:predicted phage terminase large subunit-like protein